MQPLRLTALSLIVFALTGHTPGLAQTRGHIRVVGSSTVYPFTSAVAEQFGNKTGHPIPVVESTGTGGGFKLFCTGVGEAHPDFTNASRAIKNSEKKICTKNAVIDISEMKVGYDGIVLASSSDGPEFHLTLEQIFLALARQVPGENGEWVDNPNLRWSDIDPELPDTPIEVLGPPPTSGTRDAFVELAMEEACESFPEIEALEGDARELACTAMREDGGFVEAGENDNLIVEKLASNPHLLGIFGFSFLDLNLDRLNGVSIEGVAPEYEAIADGSYPLSRPLFVYVKNAHRGLVPGMDAFINEYMSEDAFGEEGYLVDFGLIPMAGEEREQMREELLGS